MRFIVFLFVLLSIHCKAQWSIVHTGSIESADQDVYFLNSDTGFVVGINGVDTYVLRTQDAGLSWDSLGFDNHQFRTIYFPSADTGYISCFYNYSISVMRTIDGGGSWQMVATGLETAVSVPYAISFYDNDTGMINLQNYSAKTTDAGVTWSVLNNFPGGGYRDGDISDNVFIEIGSAVLGWSQNFGETFTFDTLDYQGAHSFLKARDHRFISSAIGQDGQQLGYPNGAFGIITIGDVLTQQWDITYFPYLSRVHGVSWPSENVMYAVHSSIYSEGDAAKFFMKSIDGGESWYRQETVEPGYYGTQQIFCPNDSVCYAVGGYGGRIYKTTNGGGPLLEEVSQVPLSVKEIKDDLNFSMAPNPTKGRFTLTSEKEQIKRVEIFDLRGKSVLTRFPKSHTARIDLSDYPRGVYLVQILAGEQILTGKIVVE